MYFLHSKPLSWGVEENRKHQLDAQLNAMICLKYIAVILNKASNEEGRGEIYFYKWRRKKEKEEKGRRSEYK